MPITPGDWDFDEEDGVVSAQGAPLAVVSSSDDFACLPDEGREAYDAMARANGHVMAAAPKLLAACETVKHWIEEETLVNLDELSEDAKEILATVRAAVAAAKGGS